MVKINFYGEGGKESCGGRLDDQRVHEWTLGVRFAYLYLQKRRKSHALKLED